MAPQVSDVLRVVRMQRVAPLLELLALQQAQADESELLPGRLSRVQQASRPAAPLQVQEPVPWLTPEQRPQALPVRLALPRAQPELRAHSVSQRRGPRPPSAGPPAPPGPFPPPPPPPPFPFFS